MAETWWPVVRSGDLVRYLTDEENGRLLAATESVSAVAGDSILRKGSPGRSLILVEEGDLEIVEESLGQPVVLATVGAGGVVGEVGFVDGRARTHDVRAGTAARLRRLTRERLLDLVRDDAPLFAKLTLALAELLASRFRSVVDELAPVRAFAATLREPMEVRSAAGFDEVDEAMPQELLDMIRDVAHRSQKDVAGL